MTGPNPTAALMTWRVHVPQNIADPKKYPRGARNLQSPKNLCRIVSFAHRPVIYMK
jgi:hypothetical protein